MNRSKRLVLAAVPTLILVLTVAAHAHDSTTTPHPVIGWTKPPAATADFATNAGNASTANFATSAGTANSANTANTANSANTANFANSSNTSGFATNAQTAQTLGGFTSTQLLSQAAQQPMTGTLPVALTPCGFPVFPTVIFLTAEEAPLFGGGNGQGFYISQPPSNCDGNGGGNGSGSGGGDGGGPN